MKGGVRDDSKGMDEGDGLGERETQVGRGGSLKIAVKQVEVGNQVASYRLQIEIKTYKS